MSINYMPYTGTKDINVGKGRVYFAEYLPDGTLSSSFRLLGNCPGFTLNVTSETLQHRTSMTGTSEIDKEVQTTVDRTGTITCDEVNAEVAKYFFQGEIETLTAAAATITNELHVGVLPESIIQLGASTENPTGAVNVTPASIVVTNVAGTTTYVLGTDYSIANAELGLINILPETTIPSGASIHVDYAITTSSRKVTKSGVNPLVVAVKFIADNLGSNFADNTDILMPRVTVRPDGDFGLISEEWNSLSFGITPVPYLGQAAVYLANRNIES